MPTALEGLCSTFHSFPQTPVPVVGSLVSTLQIIHKALGTWSPSSQLLSKSSSRSRASVGCYITYVRYPVCFHRHNPEGQLEDPDLGGQSVSCFTLGSPDLSCSDQGLRRGSVAFLGFPVGSLIPWPDANLIHGSARENPCLAALGWSRLGSRGAQNTGPRSM